MQWGPSPGTVKLCEGSLTGLLVSPPPRRSHENKNTFTKYSKCFFRRWNMKYVCETLDICVTNPQTFDLIIPTYFRPCLGKSRSQESMHNVPVQTFGKGEIYGCSSSNRTECLITITAVKKSGDTRGWWVEEPRLYYSSPLPGHLDPASSALVSSSRVQSTISLSAVTSQS